MRLHARPPHSLSTGSVLGMGFLVSWKGAPYLQRWPLEQGSGKQPRPEECKELTQVTQLRDFQWSSGWNLPSNAGRRFDT